MCEEKIGRYVMFPRVDVCCPDARVYEGAGAIARALGDACGTGKCVLSIECYPGVDQQELLDGLAALHPALVIHSDDLAFEPESWMPPWSAICCPRTLCSAS